MNAGLWIWLAAAPLCAQPPSGPPPQAVDLSSTSSGLPGAFVLPATAPVTAEIVLKGFERLDSALKTVQASFSQELEWEGSGTSQRAGGRFFYQTPDLFRIEQSTPEAQVTVSDGRRIWVWRISTNQVIKTRLDAWKRSEPLAQNLLDLGHYASLLSRYELVGATAAIASSGERDIDIRLKPRDPKARFRLALMLSSDDFFPREALLSAGDLSIRTLFSAIHFNEPVPDSMFRFRPPPDAEVFDNPSLPGVVNQ